MKVFIQGSATPIDLTQKDYLAQGGDLNTTLRCGMLIESPPWAMRSPNAQRLLGRSRTTLKNMQKVWRTLLDDRSYRWEVSIPKQSEVLSGLLSFRFAQHENTSRTTGRLHIPYVQGVRETFRVSREKRQPIKSSQERMRILSGGVSSTKSKSQSHCIQRRGMCAMRVPQIRRGVVFPPPQPRGQSVHHFGTMVHFMGKAAGRVGQMRSALPDLPCRNPRGGQ